jgi:hypothetical protein
MHREVHDDFTGGPRLHRVLTVTHDLAIRNELRTDIQGELRLGPLPPGGRGIKDLVQVGPLGEMGLTRKPLSWELDGPLPCDLDGHYAQRIRLDAAASGEVEVDAVLSVAQAPTALKPINVDGDLGDWLPNEYNAAGDFRLITQALDAGSGRAPPPADRLTWGTESLPLRSGERGWGPDSPPLLRAGQGWDAGSAANRPRATSQTVAYFCRSATMLYVAIHAACPPADGDETEPKRITTQIEYDQLAPAGEDLVEILIDPTNCGTLSDDLYHIVIKSNGIGVFERGIGMTPAIGRAGPWPGAPPQHAVVRTPYGWSAELAIPLAALGRPGRGTVWGLNLARVEPQRGEYSDWARAPRHCYDPRTLGNLLWPE